MMDTEDLAKAALTIVAFVVLFVGIWAFQSSQEAAAFERVTGRHVSTWDAMWIELRVQEGPAERSGGPR